MATPGAWEQDANEWATYSFGAVRYGGQPTRRTHLRSSRTFLPTSSQSRGHSRLFQLALPTGLQPSHPSAPSRWGASHLRQELSQEHLPRPFYAEPETSPQGEGHSEDRERCPAVTRSVVRLVGEMRDAGLHHDVLGSASIGCPCVSRHAARNAGSNKEGGTQSPAFDASWPAAWEDDACGVRIGAAWTGSGEEVRTDPGCVTSRRGGCATD